jgi:tRNA-Thr(GGU) m(6)t(6)A37 methyltransferase TsaA
MCQSTRSGGGPGGRTWLAVSNLAAAVPTVILTVVVYTAQADRIGQALAGATGPVPVPAATADRAAPRPPRTSGEVVVAELQIWPVGSVESALRDRDQAPRQGDEGAPDAWIAFQEAVRDALAGLRVGDRVLVLTWLHRARRDVLRVHPRGDPARPLTGVFSTRSPDRPNPIGLHRVTILAIDGTRVLVGGLEALDGTPVVDVKPVLGEVEER